MVFISISADSVNLFTLVSGSYYCVSCLHFWLCTSSFCSPFSLHYHRWFVSSFRCLSTSQNAQSEYPVHSVIRDSGNQPTVAQSLRHNI
ncbi:hypothetical protein BDD12DRAFT_133009 [Trichophaea hybrida]|nr:hypothetical protein BDD12DRAFT_133009 [Trichophaea hybrida]